MNSIIKAQQELEEQQLLLFFEFVHERVKKSDVYKCVSSGMKLIELERE